MGLVMKKEARACPARERRALIGDIRKSCPPLTPPLYRGTIPDGIGWMHGLRWAQESYFRRIRRFCVEGRIIQSSCTLFKVGVSPLPTVSQKPHEEFCLGRDYFVSVIGSADGDDSG